MKTSSQILLTLLLNACWQIALVAALASVSSWLFRNSAARYRHWIWVVALLLSVGIPLTTGTRVLRQGLSSNSPQAKSPSEWLPTRWFKRLLETPNRRSEPGRHWIVNLFY